MPNYRRAREGGSTYFFTVVTRERRHVLVLPHVLNALREAFSIVKQAKPFDLDAIVILPDHLHAIWTLPPEDADFSGRWGSIKRHVSKASGIAATNPTHSMLTRQESGFWQRRFWEHLIRNDEDYKQHMDYIHFNPVRHGYAKRPTDWPHSSFHKCVERGLYPADWASGADIDGEFGE
jgi:putative transposase